MTKIDVEAIVGDYLRQLDAALQRVAPRRRDEVIEEVRAHISQSRAELGDQTTPAVLGLLDRLGTPAEIAAAALAESEEQDLRRPSGGSGTLEGFTLGLLLVGGFLFVIGWFVGVVLLWTSNAWRFRDKVLGTFLFPGGLVLPVLLIFGPGRIAFGRACVQNIPAGGTPLKDCASTISPSWGGIALLAAAVIVPIFVAIHLHRARRSQSIPALVTAH